MVEPLLRRVKALRRTRASSETRRNAGTARELMSRVNGRQSVDDCRDQRVFVEAKMLKKLMISAAVSALMVSGALAQATPPATPATPPAAKASPPPASEGGAKFIGSQSQDQWVFSKFKGTDVLGPDNAHIGNVNDMLMDRQGKVLGLIVGVGGFLGIGEKSGPLDMSAFQVAPPEARSPTRPGGGRAASRSKHDPPDHQLNVP